MDPTPLPPADAPTPTPTALIDPPYRLDNGGRPQSPGTIEFGVWESSGLATYSGFPYGFGIAQDLGFGAYWGYPVGVREITITLYELRADAWHRLWSDAKQVDATDAGFADTLVRFERPGVYRLEVGAGADALASSLMRMDPPCVENCSGG